MNIPLEEHSSPLATYYNKAKYCYTRKDRNSKTWDAPDTITIHCYVAQVTAKQGCDYFAGIERVASCNYVVGTDGSIGISVPENQRSACTSDTNNDARAVTIEVASDRTHPYAVTSAAYDALINLIADICHRNNIKKLNWSEAKTDRVNHLNGCNMTVHRDYANKSCPGDYLYERHGDIAAAVNALLYPLDKVVFETLESFPTSVSAKLTLNDLEAITRYEWLYRITTLDGKIGNEEPLLIKDIENVFEISNLTPATAYYLDILARTRGSKEAVKCCSRPIIYTKQFIPGSVSDLTVSFNNVPNSIVDKNFTISFSPPKKYVDSFNATAEPYYYVCLIVNGAIVNKKKYKKALTNKTLKIGDFGNAVKVHYGDTVQLGIQTCIANTNGTEIFDSEFPKCTAPVFLQVPNATRVDKIFINNKKRCILYLNSNEV